jgi:hypothetical protein
LCASGFLKHPEKFHDRIHGTQHFAPKQRSMAEIFENDSDFPLRRSRIHLESLFRLNREADRDFGGTVKHLDQLVAKQAMILALGAGPGRQFDSAIAGVALGAGDVGFFHFETMPRVRTAFQPGTDHILFYPEYLFFKRRPERAD